MKFTMKTEEIENKINKIIPLSKTNLFYKNKLILTSNTLVKLETDIKEKINKPKKDKEVYIIRVIFEPDEKSYMLTINCSKKILTTNLELINVIGSMKTIIYTYNDLKILGFKSSHIKKIIKIVEKKLLAKKIISNINEVIDLF